MRDGTRLSADIFRPDDSGRFPAILIRTPYNKAGIPGWPNPREEATWFAERGYAVLMQDVRGRHDSEGEWVPFAHESDDGFDTQQWAAQQPWSNGKVITYGGSYLSIVQWLAAMRQNPNLKGMISIVGPSDFYDGLFYQGGAFNHALAIMWAGFADGRVIQPQEIESAPWPKAFAHQPTTDAMKVVGRDPKFYRDWLAHPTYDGYWYQLRFEELYEKFNFPVINVGGWFDLFQNPRGTIDSFQKLRARSPVRVREGHRLIMGPWPHAVNSSSKVGDLEFGPQAIIPLREIYLRWADHYIKGIDNGADRDLPVKLFTMGENAWHDYADWPVPGTQYKDYFLHSGGQANSSMGVGTLTPSAPAASEKADQYAYDPASPTPNAGGGNCCWPEIVPWGPLDQRSVERRDDVLVYTTPPLTEDVRVTGPIQARLWVASSARDTDFVVRLVDVYPNGFAMNLTDGILRARYRNSFEKPEFLEPKRPYELTIELGATSNLFAKGHQIRVEVASANFPRFSRNTNTGNQPELDTQMQVAQQTIFHDPQHPSRIILPVLPR
jgi:putative CocE/NonD family hydrolase